MRSSTEATGPHGLVNASSGAVSIAAGSSNLTMQALRDLYFSVDPAYRLDAEWGMSDEALQAIMDFEDQDGRPLVEPNVRAGAPQLLLGKPIRIINSLPDLATGGNKPIFFGDFRAFAIRDVRQLVLFRFDERFMANRQKGFVGYFRTDARPLFSSTVAAANRPLRCLRIST